MNNDIILIIFVESLCTLGFIWGYLTGLTIGISDGRRESEHGKTLSKTDKDKVT